MEDEARLAKSDFYRLQRDLGNLLTFTANLNNLLMAKPERFAATAPPGLITARHAINNMLATINLVQEVNQFALTQSQIAESLSEQQMVPVLFSAGRLHLTLSELTKSIEAASSQVHCFQRQLGPLFIFVLSAQPVTSAMQAQIRDSERWIQELAPAFDRLAELESSRGLPNQLSYRMAELRPRLKIVGQEMADISQAMADISMRLDPLISVNSRLEPITRMAANMDAVRQALRPLMTMLKRFGQILANESQRPMEQTLQDYCAEKFQDAMLPDDLLMQSRFGLTRQLDQYIKPMLDPLRAIIDEVLPELPTDKMLSDLDGDIARQQARLQQALQQVANLSEELVALEKTSSRRPVAL